MIDLAIRPMVFISLWLLSVCILSELSEKLEGKPTVNKLSFICGFAFTLFPSVYILNYQISYTEIICLSLCLASQFVAASMDHLYKEVYDFFHVLSLISMVILFCFGNVKWSNLNLLGIGIFIGIQLIFSLTYGLSDMFAFDIMGLIVAYQICVTYKPRTAYKIDVWNYLLYSISSMLLCYIVFAIIQAFKKNINRKGNCKEKAALIPSIYIGESMFFVILAMII